MLPHCPELRGQPHQSFRSPDFDVDRDEQDIKDICVSLGIDYDKIPPATDVDDEMVGTSPSHKSPPASEGQAESPVSPLTLKSVALQASPTSVAFSKEYAVHPDTSSISSSVYVTSTTSLDSTRSSPARSLKDHTQGSPTSVMFFGDSEAEKAPALPDLSKSVHSKLLDFVLPSVSTPVTTRDVSSTYEKESDSHCFSYGQDLLSNSISTETFSNALACFFITPCFFSYWFDGFWSSQCPCALIVLIILSGDPFYVVAPKVRLSKYLKYVIICLDLACTKA